MTRPDPARINTPTTTTPVSDRQLNFTIPPLTVRARRSGRHVAQVLHGCYTFTGGDTTLLAAQRVILRQNPHRTPSTLGGCAADEEDRHGDKGSEQTPPRIPPTGVVRWAFAMRNRLRRAADAMLPPQGVTAERTFLLAEIKLLGVVCDLRIPESIDARRDRRRGPSPIRVGAKADPVDRVLRFLASRGWFVRRRDGSYRLNARSRALRADDAQSLREWVRFMAADWHWDIWNHASERGRVGRVSGDGRDRDARSSIGCTRNDPMPVRRSTARCSRCRAWPAPWCSRPSISTACVRSAMWAEEPVGCCARCSMRARRSPGPCSISTTSSPARRRFSAIYPSTVGAPWAAASSTRARYRPGTTATSCRRSCTTGATPAAGEILDNVRAAMPADGRVWVVDSVLDPAERDDISKAVDVLMLMLTEGGRERTQAEWERLFAAHGFRIESQVQLPLLIWVFTLVRR